MDDCQRDARSGIFTIAMLYMYYLFCCIFEFSNVVFTHPSSSSSPPWLLVHWLRFFSSFLCCYHKSLDCSLVGQVQIVCTLHERHKGQFRSTLPPSLTLHLVLGWRQGSSMVGQTEEEKRRGWRAGRRHSELPWAAKSLPCLLSSSTLLSLSIAHFVLPLLSSYTTDC